MGTGSRYRRVVLAAAVGFMAAMGATAALAQNASVSVEKIDAPDPVIAGANLTYTITISNEGPANAANAAVSDVLPVGTSFVSLAAPGGWTCLTPAVGASGTVSCTHPAMAAGSEVFTLVVAVAANVPNGSMIANTATISSTTPDPDPNDNQATAVTAVTTQADLSVVKSDTPDPVSPGGTLTYSITVGNSGPSDAANVTLSDVLPAGLGFASLAAPGGWSCLTPAVGASGTVSCNNTSLAPGSAGFSLVVSVSPSAVAGSTIANTAAVTSDTADPIAANDQATAVTSVLSPAAISATKTVGGMFVPGGAVVYTITLSNAGPANQGDYVGDEFTDILPSTLALNGATSSSGVIVANLLTNTVTWNGQIAAGGSVVITINATISSSIAGTFFVSNQGQFRFDADGNGTNEASGLTDNPGLPGSADATDFTVGGALAVPAMGRWAWTLLAVLLALSGGGVLRKRSIGRQGSE